MSFDDYECTVTISRKRYAELVIAENDANRLKDIIARAADNYVGFDYKELQLLRDLLVHDEGAKAE
jgi:hypothetical protein